MRAAIVAGILIATFGAIANAQQAEPCRYFTFSLSLNISLTTTNNGFSAESSVTCYDEYTNVFAGAFTAEAHVDDETGGGTVASDSFEAGIRLQG